MVIRILVENDRLNAGCGLRQPSRPLVLQVLELFLPLAPLLGYQRIVLTLCINSIVAMVRSTPDRLWSDEAAISSTWIHIQD